MTDTNKRMQYKPRRTNQRRTGQKKVMLVARLDASLVMLLKARAIERGVSYASILAQGIKKECNGVQV